MEKYTENRAVETNAVCPNCGKHFHCGIEAGEERCWCMDLPFLTGDPVPGGDCLCPDCLARALEHKNQ